MPLSAQPSVFSSIPALRREISDAKQKGLTVGLVPTMGALHAGHFRLIEVARRECGFVAVSIFVNPLQFDRLDDLARYPRTLDEDLTLCASAGVDAIFAPSVDDLYPEEQRAFIDIPDLTQNLCGAFRPGHFRGVATVVLKLFGIVQPDRAYFGQKDAQQLAVIRHMVRDLNIPIEIVSVPTVREDDGLALSSRNKHLSPAEREVAPALYRALSLATEQVASGERAVARVRERALQHLQEHPEFSVEYFEIVNPLTLQPVEEICGPVLIAAAAWLGSTRLIDNILWTPGD